MTALDDVAPYPRRKEDVTAQAIERHYAAFTLMHHHRALNVLDEVKDRDAYRASVNMTCLGFLLTAALRCAFSQAGDKADEYAAQLWMHDQPTEYGEWLWQWLREYGVDPAAVTAMAERMPKPKPCGCKADSRCDHLPYDRLADANENLTSDLEFQGDVMREAVRVAVASGPKAGVDVIVAHVRSIPELAEGLEFTDDMPGGDQ